MKTKDKLIELSKKISENEVIIELNKIMNDNNYCNSMFLTGGAIVDILEDRKPKDYDILVRSGSDVDELIRKIVVIKEFKFLYSSSTSHTFLFNGEHIIQFLKFDTDVFHHKIEQSIFSIKYLNLELFCLLSFENKVLIPNDEAFNTEGKRKIKKKVFKRRVKKWASKGYTIPDITYKSYLKQCTGFTLFGKVLNNPLNIIIEDDYDLGQL